MPCIINWCSSFTPPPSLAASSLSIASNFSGKASHFLLIVARCIVGGCRINHLVRCLRQGVGWQGGVQEEGGEGEVGGGGEGVGGEGRSSSGPEHHMSISNSVCKTTINQIGTIASIYQIITARRLCYDDQGQPDVTRVNRHMQGGEQ